MNSDVKDSIQESDLIRENRNGVQKNNEDYFEKMDKEIERQLSVETGELEQLEIDRKSIGDPKKITESISQIVWKQFIIQIAGTAGSDFVEANHDLNLSLKKVDHYLNEQSFYEGDIPSHNFANSQKYNQRREKYFSNFQRDENGQIVTHRTRMGTEEPYLVKGARKIYDKGRPNGSKANHTDMDHTISTGEIMRDKCAGAFLNEDEKVKFANSKANLHEMDSNLNRSKGDLSTTDWMNKPNDRGQKPKEIFNISDKQEEKIWRDEKEAREEYKKTLDLAEKRANQEGRNSRISEFQRSAKFTTQAVAVALMAKLTKTIFQEVIKWLSEKEHKSKDLINRIKKAINSFVFDFKNNVLISIDVATTTILTQLFGEIIPMIKKAMLFLSIGGKSAVDIAKYLNDPSNTGKDTSTKMLEIGEIFVTGLTAAGGVALGMSITITLTKFLPQLATFQIPLLGSTAELLGIFFGGLTAGICGAIVMNIIEGKLSGNMLNENDLSQIDKIENVLKLQNKQFGVYENIVAQASSTCATNIVSDFVQARKKLEKIRAQKDEPIKSDNEDKFDCLTNLIGDL